MTAFSVSSYPPQTKPRYDRIQSFQQQSQWPRRTASGFFNESTKQWQWEQQQWHHCSGCGLYHGNRLIPSSFWKRDWCREKKRNTSGVILTRTRNYNREFFVVQSYHNFFGFPKGKQEDGETMREAASRELKEETGIEHSLDNCLEFRQSCGEKQISFFLLELKEKEQHTPTIPCNTAEITSFGWILEKDLKRLKLNRITKDILAMYYRFY